MPTGSSVVVVDDESEWVNKDWTRKILGATLDLIPSLWVERFNIHSVDAARRCVQTGMKFDSVFIDGDHNYAECKADIQAWMPLLRQGGLICGHDYWPAHIGVMDAVNEVFDGRHSVVPGTRIWFARV